MWKVLGGSVVGRTHTAKSLPCQDASGWHSTQDCVCLVVADGAGSRAHSQLGAQAAVAAIIEWASTLQITPRLDDLRGAFALARAAVEEAAGAADVPVDDLACTLAGAVIARESFLFGQVGDSLAFVRDRNGNTQTIEPPGRSEYLNETVFLTAEEWADTLRLVELPSEAVHSVALSTDGLQFKILSDVQQSTPYTPFFDDLFAWARTDDAHSAGLLAFIEELDDQSGDDKTLLLAVRIEQAEDDPSQKASVGADHTTTSTA